MSAIPQVSSNYHVPGAGLGSWNDPVNKALSLTSFHKPTDMKYYPHSLHNCQHLKRYQENFSLEQVTKGPAVGHQRERLITNLNSDEPIK